MLRPLRNQPQNEKATTHLETKAARFARKMTHLAQIPRIDIAPSIPLPHIHLHQILLEIPSILVRFDDVADPERIDVDAFAVFVGFGETSGEGASGEFADLFR